MSEEGLENLWARHLAAHNQLWEGLSSLGLKPFVENEQDRCARAGHGWRCRHSGAVTLNQHQKAAQRVLGASLAASGSACCAWCLLLRGVV